MKRVLFLLAFCFASALQAAIDLSPLESLVVQEGGRKKPLLTYSQESVQKLLGRATWKKSDAERLTSMEVLMSMMFDEGEDWDNAQIIRVGFRPLKKAVGLNEDQLFFSIKELSTQTNLFQLVSEARKKRMQMANPEVSKTETEAEQVAGKMLALRALVSGSGLKVVPHPSAPRAEWVTVTEAGRYYPQQADAILDSFKAIVTAYQAKDSAAIASSVAKFKSIARELSPQLYPSDSRINLEVTFDHTHPFRKAWIFYLCSLLAMMCALPAAQKNFRSKLYWPAMLLYFVGLGFQIYGFYCRCTIAGRPPVTNMYEVMIWVAFGTALFALIFELIYRKRYFVLAAAAVSTLSLVLADNLPAVLDPSIKPLVPVLVNNYWLTVHVLTINLGYAGFLLALGIGHIALGYCVFKPGALAKITELTQFNYRAMQVGLLFLTAGTILGGVWANDSWGRFWGWDPKETWALISILCYLVVLHGRFAGWMGDFALNVASVLCFQAIIFAAYGVNFVLGKGLHSYGFGVGGEWAVASYVAVEVAVVAVAVWRYKLQAARTGPPPPPPQDGLSAPA